MLKSFIDTIYIILVAMCHKEFNLHLFVWDQGLVISNFILKSGLSYLQKKRHGKKYGILKVQNGIMI